MPSFQKFLLVVDEIGMKHMNMSDEEESWWVPLSYTAVHEEYEGMHLFVTEEEVVGSLDIYINDFVEYMTGYEQHYRLISLTSDKKYTDVADIQYLGSLYDDVFFTVTADAFRYYSPNSGKDLYA